MRKGIETIITGVICFVVVAVILPFLLILSILLGKSANDQFKVPGKIKISAGKPGRYYLWNDYETVFDGRSFNVSKTIPDGVFFKVKNENGEILNFVSESSISSTIGGSARNSIGFVVVETPTTLDITVSGEISPRIFSVGPSGLAKIFGLFIASFAFAVFGATGGIGLIVWGIVKLVISSKKAATSVPPPL